MERDLAALRGEFPWWRIWRWNGLWYARRERSSPPVVLRAPSAGELRDMVRAHPAQAGG